MKAIVNRIFRILSICILLIIWATGLGFGWIATGKDLTEGTWIDNKLEELINK